MVITITGQDIIMALALVNILIIDVLMVMLLIKISSKEEK